MLNFIFGGAGSGKSTLISERIIEDLKNNKRVLLLVPEQQMVISERSYAKITDGLPALNLEIMNFTRLADSVFRTYGGLCYNYIDKSAQMLLMWKTLEALSPVLEEYSGITLSDRAFIARLIATVNQLRMSKISEKMLEDASRVLCESDKGIAKKLHDLSLIYSAYEGLLHEGYDDPADDLNRLCEKLKEHNYFGEIKVYIDSFSGFNAVEYDVLRQIIKQADEVTVSLCYTPGDDSDVFSEAKGTYNDLRKIASSQGVSIGDTTVLNTQLRYKNEELKFLEANLFRFSKGNVAYQNECEHISVVATEDSFACADKIVNHIRKRVNEDGLRYRDFAVIARNADNYKGIIDAAFEAAGIPYFMSQREQLTSKPLVRFIFTALSVVSRGWQTSDMTAYIKSGFSGITADESCVLESYISAWKISGKRWSDGVSWNMNPDGYTDVVTERTTQILDTVNALREKIVPPLESLCDSLSGGCSVHEAVLALYNFLCELEIDKNAQAEGDVSVWNAVMKVLDSIDGVLSDSTVTAEKFSRMLAAAAGCEGIGRIPHSDDEVVIGSAAMLRTESVKDVFLIGLNKGEFPQGADFDGIFTAKDMELLSQSGIDLGKDEGALLDAELYFFYKAATLASENVTFMHLSDEENAQGSYFCEHIKRLFPLHMRDKTDNAADNIIKFGDGFDRALNPKTNADRALLEIYRQNEKLRGRIAGIEGYAENKDNVSEETAEKLFGGNLTMTQSRLERFVLCNFSYYCKYVLKLSENRRVDFISSDIGNFVHGVLEKFMQSLVSQNAVKTVTDSEAERLADEIIDSYIKAVCGDVKYLSRRLTALFERLRRTIKLLLSNITSEFRQSSFKAKWFELPISYYESGVKPLAIPMPDGTAVYIAGKVDRVDVYYEGENAYIRVVDYKTGTKKFNLDEVLQGLNLQMLLYLFAIWNDPEKKVISKDTDKKNAQILPAGVMYYTAKAPELLLSEGYGERFDDKILEEKIARSGLFVENESVLRAMDTNLDGTYIPIKLKKDGSLSGGSSLKSLEEMGALMGEISGVVRGICGEMKKGSSAVNPKQLAGHDACAYCAMRPVCRVSREQNQSEEGEVDNG